VFDVLPHLSDQCLGGIKGRHVAQALNELNTHRPAIQIEITLIQAVSFDSTLGSGEGGVRTNRNRGHEPFSRGAFVIEDAQSAGINPVGRGGHADWNLNIGGMKAQVATALIANDDFAIDSMRSTQDRSSGTDISGHQGFAHRS
jgi:hypothetical protein